MVMLNDLSPQAAGCLLQDDSGGLSQRGTTDKVASKRTELGTTYTNTIMSPLANPLKVRTVYSNFARTYKGRGDYPSTRWTTSGPGSK